MVYNKRDFENHIVKLQIEEFEMRSAVQAYLFVREKLDRTETITVSYKDYAPHGFYITGVSADVFLNDVESILTPLLLKYGINGAYNSSIGKSFQRNEGIDYSIFDIEINNEST